MVEAAEQQYQGYREGASQLWKAGIHVCSFLLQSFPFLGCVSVMYWLTYLLLVMLKKWGHVHA
jgi:hypothetical protein